MDTDEFSLIAKYFAGCGPADSTVIEGIGDDAALVELDAGDQLVVTTDTLISDVHFPATGAPQEIAQRALRVNISDLAAMGARPRWFVLALTLPQADDRWLSAFSCGLHEAATALQCVLIGGDTNRGPLAITITAFGSVKAGSALLRDGARPDDYVYVTGRLGDSAAGLAVLQRRLHTSSSVDQDCLVARFWRPTPRVAAGQLLRCYASSAIDISDGLLADLGHITRASGVGAELELSKLPLSPSLTRVATAEQARSWALCGGDDYELCFTVSSQNNGHIDALLTSGELDATLIGRIVRGDEVVCLDPTGQRVAIDETGYSHF